MSRNAFPEVLLQEVVALFDTLIGRFGEHAVAAGDKVYIQPYVYLSFHLVQMRAAGWTDVDFDLLAAVSGASALFAYQPGEFMPKYAHLYVDADARIAATTGFGYEWVDFEGAEGAWKLLKECIDSGRSVKGWDWENILFAGYQEAAQVQDRRVFAMADGPETFAQWQSWSEFTDWVQRTTEWGCSQFGRYAERVPIASENGVVRQVMVDLVDWSIDPPAAVRDQFPEATFGLAGIEAYAADCADLEQYDDWIACHGINPQWTVRNSTAVYLKRAAQSGAFAGEVNGHVLDAAGAYRAAYAEWGELYELLGHGATEAQRKDKERREAAAAAIRRGLEYEKAGLEQLRIALSLIEE